MRGLIFVLSGVLLLGSALPAAANENLRLRDYRQILLSLEAITGVDRRDPQVAGVYSSVERRLPIRGEVSEINASLMTAMLELGGAFCSAMIDSDAQLPTQLRRAHTRVRFDRGLNQLTNPVLEATIAEYAELFWQRDATPGEAQLMMETATEAIGLSASQGTQATRGVLQILCGLTATSLGFLVY